MRRAKDGSKGGSGEGPTAAALVAHGRFKAVVPTTTPPPNDNKDEEDGGAPVVAAALLRPGSSIRPQGNRGEEPSGEEQRRG